jgi:LacI family transcriptional regulator
MERKITIKDIAEEMSVSITTVSRALNGKKGVSDKLKREINKKAEELGYIRNFMAGSLKTSKSKTIGVIVSDIRNPFFLDFLKGIDNILFLRGYNFFLNDSGENIEKEKIYLNWMIEHRVNGILTSPVGEKEGQNNLKLYKKISDMGIPIVFYDRTFSGEIKFDSVTVDNKDSIIQAIKYLKDKGHKDIAIFLSKSGIYTIEKRLEGFLEGCKLLGIPINDSWICKDLFPEEKTFLTLKKLKENKKLPTAIIATNNKITKQLISASKQLNISVPETLSIVGYDDLPENEIIKPSVTCIKQPVFEIGRISATILLEKVENNVSEPTKIVLKTEIIERESVCDLNNNSV